MNNHDDERRAAADTYAGLERLAAVRRRIVDEVELELEAPRKFRLELVDVRQPSDEPPLGSTPRKSSPPGRLTHT